MEKTFPDVKDYYIFGHDIGAIVGLRLAAKHPAKVRGVCMLSPTPFDGLRDNKNRPTETIEDLKKFPEKVRLAEVLF